MEASPIRKAAAAICAREGADGPEVLVVERGAGSRFLPGYLVFPGGAVDAEDGAHAERWFGRAAHAHRAAAIRELIEEAGLVLTAAGLAVVDPEHPFERVDALPPVADQLAEIAHWVAPEDVPVRFDARYFAVGAQTAVEPRPDGEETVRAWWASPRRLMAAWSEGRHKLYWPTFFTMGHLAACASVEQMLALSFDTRGPTDEEIATLPRSVMEQDR